MSQKEGGGLYLNGVKISGKPVKKEVKEIPKEIKKEVKTANK